MLKGSRVIKKRVVIQQGLYIRDKIRLMQFTKRIRSKTEAIQPRPCMNKRNSLQYQNPQFFICVQHKPIILGKTYSPKAKSTEHIKERKKFLSVTSLKTQITKLQSNVTKDHETYTLKLKTHIEKTRTFRQSRIDQNRTKRQQKTNIINTLRQYLQNYANVSNKAYSRCQTSEEPINNNLSQQQKYGSKDTPIARLNIFVDLQEQVENQDMNQKCQDSNQIDTKNAYYKSKKTRLRLFQKNPQYNGH